MPGPVPGTEDTAANAGHPNPHGADVVVGRDDIKCVLSHSAVSDSLHTSGPQPARLFCPWDFSGKNTGMGCHSLLQGIFLTQGIKPRSPASPVLQADSLPTEPLRKALNRDVKSCVNKMLSHGSKCDEENKAGQCTEVRWTDRWKVREGFPGKGTSEQRAAGISYADV